MQAADRQKVFVAAKSNGLNCLLAVASMKCVQIQAADTQTGFVATEGRWLS